MDDGAVSLGQRERDGLYLLDEVVGQLSHGGPRGDAR